MNTVAPPWHGVLVATCLPFTPELAIDEEAFSRHVAWLAANGCHGVVPNGSLGEYQVLTPEERRRVVDLAVKAAPPGFVVMPGVGAYGAVEAQRCAQEAADAGAQAVMSLPPNSYRSDARAVLEHFTAVAKAGLPVVAYNNPFDTRTDLTPALLASLHAEGLIVAVKEFTGDVRRTYAIQESAPGLDVLIGSDDVALEVALAGAVGWITGYANVFPRSSVTLFESAVRKDLDQALPLYRKLHPLLRWDSQPEFVQAIKLSMDAAGLPGGPCRPPRQPLSAQDEQQIRDLMVLAIADGLG